MTPDQPVPYTLTGKAHAALADGTQDPDIWDLDTTLPRQDAS